MRIALAVLLASHALIHSMGFLVAFGFAEFHWSDSQCGRCAVDGVCGRAGEL